jgi:hypothetical protein
MMNSFNCAFRGAFPQSSAHSILIVSSVYGAGLSV